MFQSGFLGYQTTFMLDFVVCALALVVPLLLYSLWLVKVRRNYLGHKRLQIALGLILLVGLVKKNGIMMIDFALQMQREKNMTPHDAIIEACSVRFRPIMMTTGAAIFATLPIAMGYGAGAETRRPLGIAVVGGLVFSQFLTLYVTPVFYVSMESLAGYFRKKKAPAEVVAASVRH